MVAKTHILFNLKEIKKLYLEASSAKAKLFFSKLAILELCGWIEESMDDIILSFARKKVGKPDNLKIVENKIVKRNYGFLYDDHFRGMMLRLIGIINVENLESIITDSNIINFSKSLENLKKIRDSEAHTFVKGVTKTIQAPSVTISNLEPIYKGLKEFEKNLKDI